VPVTRRRSSLVCEAEGHLLLVRLRDPTTGVVGLYPPGGAIEPNETPAETARRETLEETGLHVRVDEASELVDSYPFRWDGVDIAVTTHWFLGALEGAFAPPPPVLDAAYHLGALWVPVESALRAMAVHPPILASVERLRAWRRSTA
jgi:8-oxo-dGTP pyrophosphatase MutT (NUDIX family)